MRNEVHIKLFSTIVFKFHSQPIHQIQQCEWSISTKEAKKGQLKSKGIARIQRHTSLVWKFGVDVILIGFPWVFS